MPHPFTTYFGLDDLHTAFLTHDPAMFHSFVFTAITFIVLDGAEYLGAKQAVALGFESAVVDRLRLGDFAVGPGPDLFRARQADPDGVEISD